MLGKTLRILSIITVKYPSFDENEVLKKEIEHFSLMYRYIYDLVK